MNENTMPELANNFLQGFFKTSDDVIFETIISNINFSSKENIINPNDLDMGVMCNLLEYLRKLSVYLLAQMVLTTADDEFLKYMQEEFFQNYKLEFETNESWVARTQAKFFSHKISDTQIILRMREFSPLGEPEIYYGTLNSMFADTSFADFYERKSIQLDGETFYVSPAIASSGTSSLFFITIVLYGFDASNIYSVHSAIRDVKAAGIEYEIVLR